MKTLKLLSLLLACACMVFVSSCKKDDPPPKPMNAADVDTALLIGTWKSDRPFYSNKPDSYNYKRYTSTVATVSNSTINDTYKDGKDWTIGDTEENSEGVEFYYRVDGNVLREQHPDMSIYILRVYTLMTLTASRLQYFDQFNEVYSFTKQ
jgi:hypothetical protein